MNKSRSTVVFGSLILVVLIAAGWFLLLSPRMGKPGEIRAEQDQVAAVNATTEASIKDLQEKQKQLPQAREYASRLAERFPSTAAQAEMFEMVRDAARAAGIPEQNITDLTPSVPAIGGALDGSVTLPETGQPSLRRIRTRRPRRTRAPRPRRVPPLPRQPRAADSWRS